MPYKEKGRKTWRAKVVINGQVKTKRCQTKKGALEWENQQRQFPSGQNITDTIYLDEVTANYLDLILKTCSKTTYQNKRYALKQLADAVGNIPINTITPEAILNKIILTQKTTSASNKRRKEIHSFFEYARDFYGLIYNPVSPIKSLPEDRNPQPVPTHEEYTKILLVADRHDRNLLVVVANTGGRKGELLRLTWSEDIDFDRRLIRLGNRKNRSRELRFREIPLNDEAHKALVDQFKTRLFHSDNVFQNRAQWIDRDGNPVRNHPNYGQGFTSRRRFMRGLCARARIRTMGFHSLRRYFASKLVEDGEDLETIRYLLGHSNVSTTDRYIYRLNSDLRVVRGAVQKLNSTRLAHTSKIKNSKIDLTH